MKMKNLILICILISMAAVPAYATKEVGNGGNAVVCFNDPSIPARIRSTESQILNSDIPSIIDVEILDLHFAKQRIIDRPADDVFIMPESNETEEQYVLRLIKRVKPFTSNLYSDLEIALNSMPIQRSFWLKNGIEQINDFDLIGRIDSENCVIGTIAAHNIKNNGITDLYFDQRIMNHPKHSRASRYITYLHEVVYRALKIYNKGIASDPARDLVEVLIKKELSFNAFLRAVSSLPVSVEMSIWNEPVFQNYLSESIVSIHKHFPKHELFLQGNIFWGRKVRELSRLYSNIQHTIPAGFQQAFDLDCDYSYEFCRGYIRKELKKAIWLGYIKLPYQKYSLSTKQRKEFKSILKAYESAEKMPEISEGEIKEVLAYYEDLRIKYINQILIPKVNELSFSSESSKKSFIDLLLSAKLKVAYDVIDPDVFELEIEGKSALRSELVTILRESLIINVK